MQLVGEGVHSWPEVLDRVEIRSVRRPLQHVDLLVEDPLLHYFARERLGIVVQELPLLMPRVARVRLVVVSGRLLNSFLQQPKQRLAFQLALVRLAPARTARAEAGEDMDAWLIDAAVHGVLRVEEMTMTLSQSSVVQCW